MQPKSETVRKSVHWANRAGMHATQPILCSYDSFGERFVKLQEFDGIDAMQSIREGMSDSYAGVADDLPVAIRYYRCGESIEGGIG